MCAGFTAKTRIEKAAALQTLLMDSVDTVMRQRQSAGDTTTNAETAAHKRMKELRQLKMPLVVLDFPIRGIADEANIPREIGDAFRKYFTLPRYEKPSDANVFRAIRRLQVNSAALRVFAAQELHEMIIRYLNPKDIRAIMASIIPSVKTDDDQ